MEYLMIHRQFIPKLAFHHVKEKKNRHPNSGFMQQLIEVQKSIYKDGTPNTLTLGYGWSLIWKSSLVKM
jgi:hypothetical protein